MSEWQPIETAPKEGALVLLWIEGGVEIGFWNGKTWDDGNFYDDIGTPTHWMPLPEPPKHD